MQDVIQSNLLLSRKFDSIICLLLLDISASESIFFYENEQKMQRIFSKLYDVSIKSKIGIRNYVYFSPQIS